MWQKNVQRTELTPLPKNLPKIDELGWKPSVSVRQGVDMLWHWVTENKNLFNHP